MLSARIAIFVAMIGCAVATEKPAAKTPTEAEVPAALLPEVRKANDLFAKGDLAGAQQAFEQALAKAPENAYLLSNLGVVRFRDGRHAQAEVVLKQAVALAPKDDFSHTMLGAVLLTQGRFDSALAEIEIALTLNPKNATANHYKGICANEKGLQGTARKSFETALALDPDYADAHFNLAVLLATQQPPDKENAARHYERARALGAEADPSLERMLK